MTVCKVSRHCLLLCSSACLLNSTCQFFAIACLWMSISIIAVECTVIGVYSQGFFFAGNSTCNLTFWPELLSFAICDCISVWYFALQRDCAHKSFDLSKVSENFRNIQDLWKQYNYSLMQYNLKKSKSQKLPFDMETWKWG